jgi:hypothetical protein
MARRWLLGVVLAIACSAIAGADDKRLHAAYDGRIVISPDKVPTTGDELERYLDANATKNDQYELIKGPPWTIHLVGMLAKDPTKPVTLVFIDSAADKKTAPLQSIELPAKRRMVIANTSATTAAGFEANKTYLVQILADGKPAAKAELTLRH